MSQARRKSRRALWAPIGVAAALVLCLPAVASAAPAVKEYTPAVPKAKKKGAESAAPVAPATTEDQQLEQVAKSPELGAPEPEEVLGAGTIDSDEREGGSFPMEILLLVAMLIAVAVAAVWARRRALAAR